MPSAGTPKHDFFRPLVEFTSHGMALVDTTARITYANPAITDLLGYPPDELVGEDLLARVHPDDRDAARAAFGALLESPLAVRTAELRYQHRNGEWRWLQATARNLLHDLALGAVIVAFHEVTQRKQAEAALRQSEARFAAFMRATPSLAWMKDSDLRYVYFNETYGRRFQVDLNHWLGRSDYEVWPEVAEQLRANDLHVLRSGQPIELVESIPVPPDGEVRQCLVYKFPFTDAAGRRYVGGTAVDITERLRIEDQLRESQARYRQLYESIPLPVLMCDAESLRITDVNEAAVRHYGFSRDEFSAMSVRDLWYPAQALDVGEFHSRLSDRASVEQATIHRLKGDTPFDAEVTGHLVDVDGTRACVVVVRDVSERRKAEEKLRQTEELLHHAEKMQAIGRLAGGVAHDFNNLLTVILGYSNCALQQLEPTSPLTDDLEQIRGAAERAATLTGELLTLSRREVAIPKPLELNSVIRSLERMLRHLLGPGIDLTLRLADQARMILADRSKIERAIMNLAVNARDAMPSGGQLTISTELADTDVSERFGLRAGDYLCVRVRDTGCGMDEATRSHAFEPFFTTKPAGQGTGLGLATTYGIVQQSGGGIEIESEIGRGTTVSAYFPLVSQGLAEIPAEAPPRPATAIAQQTILLVDDEDAVRRLAHRILSQSGYAILQAGSGEEALLIAETFAGRIDLLLTDVLMPGLGSRELAERLTAQRPETAVLFMSGHAAGPQLGSQFNSAAIDFLAKPFSSIGLRDAVHDALRKRPAPLRTMTASEGLPNRG